MPAIARAKRAYARVWFLGDSLTAGYDADSSGGCFAEVTAAALRAMKGGTAVEVLRVNAYGGKASDGLAQALAGLEFTADLVLLQYGENDRPYAQAFRDTYERLAAQFGRDGRAPLIAALSIWSPTYDADAEAMDEGIRDVVEGAGGVFVSVRPAAAEAANRSAGRDVSWLGDAQHATSDAFHPNSAGHAAIAELLADALRALVRKGPPRAIAADREQADRRPPRG